MDCGACSHPMLRCRRSLWERLIGVRSAWRCRSCGIRARRWSAPDRVEREAQSHYGPGRTPRSRPSPVERGERVVTALMVGCIILFAVTLCLAYLRPR